MTTQDHRRTYRVGMTPPPNTSTRTGEREKFLRDAPPEAHDLHAEPKVTEAELRRMDEAEQESRARQARRRCQ